MKTVLCIINYKLYVSSSNMTILMIMIVIVNYLLSLITYIYLKKRTICIKNHNKLDINPKL